MSDGVQTSRPSFAKAMEGGPAAPTSGQVKVGAWVWTVWPTLPLPSEAWLIALAQQKGARAVDEYHRTREQAIANEQEEPLVYGWEQPPVAIVRALLAGTYVPGGFGLATKEGRDWRQTMPANDVVMLGGNGSGKSEVQAKIGVQTLVAGGNKEWRAFSQSELTSIRYVQKPAHHYLPAALRRVKSQGITTKISYKEATGFSESCFILPNSSAALFPTYKGYEQDRNSVEGGEADLATWDEEAPADLLKTLRFRVHKKGGYVLGGFTPVGGYTETVAEYIEAGTILEVIPCRAVVWDWWKRTWSWGEWLLPPDQELVKGCPKGHVPFVVQSGGGEGRRFAVALPTMFNPYTNVGAIIGSTAAGKGERLVQGEKLGFALERLWGWPTKLARRAFPNFGEVHIVAPERVPPLNTMTIWQWIDPHGDRNWFMVWTGVDAEGNKWTFAEWPDADVGEWAVPGPKPDGKPGPAQTSGGGKSFNEYKRLIAELEGWRPQADGTWERKEKTWEVFDRKMDPRPAGTSVPSDEEARTYIEHMEEPIRMGSAERGMRNGKIILPGLEIRAGADCGIEEGKGWVNNWINDGWDAEQEVTPMNKPRWYISRNCVNTIYALRTYTGADGLKGACKDPIDCLKGLSKSGIEYVPKGALGSYGGGFGY